MNLPKSIWEGSFKVFGVELKCHVLDDGRRIIEADSVADLLDAMGSVDPIDIGDLDNFVKWQKEYN